MGGRAGEAAEIYQAVVASGGYFRQPTALCLGLVVAGHHTHQGQLSQPQNHRIFDKRIEGRNGLITDIQTWELLIRWSKTITLPF